MNNDEKLSLLKEWEETGKNLEKFYDNLNEIMGVSVESPLSDSIFTTYLKYTKTLSKLLNDENDFLEWYYFENRFGTNGLIAGNENETRSIDSIENLLWIIELTN
jgi:hypothetical protein